MYYHGQRLGRRDFWSCEIIHLRKLRYLGSSVAIITLQIHFHRPGVHYKPGTHSEPSSRSPIIF